MNSRVDLNPRVSIGVPVRNGGEHLKKAMSSLINQTERDWEIIISDNASSDGTSDYLVALSQLDSRIQYFRQNPPLNAYDNFRFVLSKSTGGYFMWAAHDDSRDPNFIARLADRLDQDEKAVLAFGDLIIVTPDDNIGFTSPFDFATVGLDRWDRLKKTSRLQCFHIYGLWRASAIRRIPHAYCPWWPDLPIMMAAASIGEFAYVSGPKFIHLEIVKTSAERVKYQDYAERHSLLVAVLQLLVATYRSCYQICGFAPALIAMALVLWKQLCELPGFLIRRIRSIWRI